MAEQFSTDQMEEEEEILDLDGFISDDGQHQVSWQLAEITPNEQYEAWWCVTHDRLYYGGCMK